MKEKLSTFQVILFAVSIILIVAGVAFFALKRGGGGDNLVQIKLWGTLPSNLINDYKDKINEANENSVKIDYVEFTEDNFENALINALASGTGPDAVILPDSLLVKHESKLFTIPYNSYPQSTFKNSFIEAGDVLLKKEGISGLPFVIDPLVLYSNKTILNSNSIVNPPKYWDEVLEMNKVLTKSNTTGNIDKATIAMGEFKNVKNAVEILTTLILQAGNPIVVRNSQDNFVSIFNDSRGYSVAPSVSGINFFVQFSNPSKQTYTWNRALPNSDEMFLVGDLAFYIGFASEREELIKRNPNLNLGVSQLPQSRASAEDNKRFTGGKLHFLSVLKVSKNISASISTIFKLTDSKNMALFQKISGLTPVRRDLLTAVPSSDYADTFNRSALITKLFLEPDPEKTNQILADAVESVTSGRLLISDVLRKVDEDFNLMIKK